MGNLSIAFKHPPNNYRIEENFRNHGFPFSIKFPAHAHPSSMKPEQRKHISRIFLSLVMVVLLFPTHISTADFLEMRARRTCHAVVAIMEFCII